MAFDQNLNPTITPVQETSIITDLNNSKATLNGIATVTLNDDDTSHLNGIDVERLPYLQRTIEEFTNDFPNLAGLRVTPARAQNLFDIYLFLRVVDGNLDEYKDRVKDLSTNVEELLYQYMTDYYANAKRYNGTVVGADIVEDFLKELFERAPQNAVPVP